MRILMTTSFPFPGEYDGTAMMPMQIVRGLKRHGIEVMVAYLKARGPWTRPAQGEFEGIPYWTLPMAHWVSGMERIRREFPFDLVHSEHYGGATRAYFACRKNGWPMIYEIHSLLGDEVERSRLGRGIKFRVTAALERQVCRYASQVLVLGDLVKKVVIEEKGVPADRVTVFHPGVNLAEFDNPGPPPEIPGIGPEHKVVMYIGSIVHPNQGVSVLVDALPSIFKRLPEARCVLVGGPAEAGEAYRRQLGEFGDRLKVITGATAMDVARLSQRADVLVHSRLACRENYSVQSKMGVYLAAGRPIVATDFADYRRLLGDTGAGWLTEVSPEAVADGVTHVLTHPDLAAQMAAKAKPIAREWFNVDRNIERFTQIYERVLTNDCAPERAVA